MNNSNSQSVLHVSDLTAMLQCPKKALYQKSSMEAAVPHADNRGFHELIMKEYFQDVPSGKPWDSSEDSLKILQNSPSGSHLRFQYRNLRCSVPLLEKKEDGTYKAYGFYPSKHIREHSLIALMISRLIARKAGVDISEYELIHLDENFVRQKPEDLAMALVKAEKIGRSSRGWRSESVMELLDELEKEYDLDTLIDQASDLYSTPVSSVESERIRACTAPSKCPYYEDCFHESRLPDDSPAFFAGPLSKQNRQLQSLACLPEIPDGLSAFGYAQIQASKNRQSGGPGVFMDEAAIRAWNDQLVWPLCYLDFEWDTFALPPYSGMKPFDVLAFQYSLIIHHKDGSTRHSTFFGLNDCRQEFIESLISDLPNQGSIVVFNMEGAEKLRLEQLADQFEEYREPLESFCARMADLCAPFENGAYYDLRQRGKCSLKTLLPLFSKKDGYADLDIHNGVQAVFAYRQARTAGQEEKQRIAQAISDYCSMDTLAEMELYQGLIRKLEEREACQA